jgi:predicted phosphodiesterase
MTLDPEKRLSGKHNTGECMENMATSKARLLHLGVDADDWFVFGHTHRPFLDNNSRTINTGSWLEEIDDGYLYLKVEQATLSWNYSKLDRQKFRIK